MGTPTEIVTCPACGAEPGEPCYNGSDEISPHRDRLRRDEVEVRLTMSRAAAYQLAKVVSAAKDEANTSFYLEFQDVEIALAQASVDVWDHTAQAKQ